MPIDPATNVFNDGYIAELYDAYLRDPASVSDSWQQFFRAAERFAGTTTRGAPDGIERRAPDPALLKKAAGAAALMQAIRTYGHFAVQLDPLGTAPWVSAPGQAHAKPFDRPALTGIFRSGSVQKRRRSWDREAADSHRLLHSALR